MMKEFWDENKKNNWLAGICGAPGSSKQKFFNPRTHVIEVVLTDGGVYFGGVDSRKVGVVRIESEVQEYDILYAKISEQTRDLMPKSFGGMSGGGIWLFTLNTAYEIIDIQLAGIFTGQFVESTPKILVGNGPSTLYKSFLPLLRINEK